MNTQMNTKRIWIYLTLAFGLAWAALLAVYLAGVMNINVAQQKLVETLANYIFVFCPALACIMTRLITREGWRSLWLRPNFKRGWKFYLAAWLLPLLAVIPGSLIYYLLFPQAFDPNFTRARDGIVIFRSVASASPWIVMLVYTLEQMIVQGLLVSVIVIGEEFGWRAYLLQKLADHFGSARNAAVLVGVIWSVWHWPGMFLGMGVSNDYPGAPFLFPLVYLLSTTSLSILLAWVTLRSGSVWPAAVGHASELAAEAPAMGMMGGPINPVLSPNGQSMIGNLGFIALALVLYFSRKAFRGEKEAASESVRAVTSRISV